MALTTKQVQELNLASQRISAGKGSTQDVKNVNYAKSTFGYKYTPAPSATPAPTVTVLPAIKPPAVGAPIPAEQLPAANNANTQLSKLLGANVSNDTSTSDIAGLLALTNANSAETKNYQDLQGQLTSLMGQLGNQGADLQAEMDKQGVNAAFDQVKQLTLKSAQLTGEITKFDTETDQINSNIESQPVSMGLIRGQQAEVQRQRAILRQGKTADLTSTIALAQAYQGNATLGMELATRAVNLKYQPIQANIDTVRTQLDFAKETMSKADQTRAQVINLLLDDRQKALDIRRENDLKIQEIAIQAASKGAPLDIVNAIKHSADAATAATIGGRYLSGEFSQIQDLAAAAGANGAPANVISAMRQAKDRATAASIGSKYLKGNLEPTPKNPPSGSGTNPTVNPSGTQTTYGATNKGGGYFKTDQSGGRAFYDKAGNVITAAQYAVNTKSGFYEALSQSSGDKKIAQAIKSVVAQINAGKIDPQQAFQDAQAHPSKGGMGNIFSGITFAQFKSLLGVNPPKKSTTIDLKAQLHPK